MKEYGCYMDDSYLIHERKEYLWRCLEEIDRLCREKGITLNRKKTQIIRLSHGFPYMKGSYHLTETGKVIVTPSKENTVRHRRKLKKFRRFLDEGKIGYAQIICAHNSYRGYIRKDYNSHKTVRSMDKLFHELFGYDIMIDRKEKF